MQVIPSILQSDISGFWHQVEKLLPYFNHFQVDIVDGKFAQGKTVDANEILTTAQEKLEALGKPKVTFDIDFMIEDYTDEIERLEQLKSQVKIDIILLQSSLRPNLDELRIQYPEFSFGL